MCLIERETQSFILKFREIFRQRETVLRAHGMKSDEKPFFCQIYTIVWRKMVHVVIDRYFPVFLKGLKIFLNLRLSLIVPLSKAGWLVQYCLNFIHFLSWIPLDQNLSKN